MGHVSLNIYRILIVFFGALHILNLSFPHHSFFIQRPYDSSSLGQNRRSYQFPVRYLRVPIPPDRLLNVRLKVFGFREREWHFAGLELLDGLIGRLADDHPWPGPILTLLLLGFDYEPAKSVE